MVVVHMKDPHDVYGGRPAGHRDPTRVKVEEHGWLGNPFSEGTREEVIQKFKRYFWKRLNEDPVFREAVRDLRANGWRASAHPRLAI